MKIRAELYRHQFEGVEEAIESWKKDHDEAMGVCDLEDVIRVCIGLHEGTFRMVREAWQAGFNARMFDVQGAGQSLLNCLNSGVEAWETITEAARRVKDKGYSVESEGLVPRHLDEMKRLRDDFAARWPSVTEEEMRRGADQIARGEFVTGEEFCRALQDQSRQRR